MDRLYVPVVAGGREGLNPTAGPQALAFLDRATNFWFT
jgi:hypothetical protein